MAKKPTKKQAKVVVLFEEAKRLHIAKDFESAINILDKIIKINPNHVDAFSYRSAAKGMINDHQGCLNDCDQAINVNPNNSSIWNTRGIANINLGKHEEAVNDFNKAIELNPNDAIP